MSFAPGSNRGVIERRVQLHQDGATAGAVLAKEYALGHDEHELDRLIHQADLFGSITEQAIRLAGIRSGMRVLEAGCGAGDVSIQLARVVGPNGEVIAVDNAEDALTTTAQRAGQAGTENIHTVLGDLTTLRLDAPVDAVVGRLILMHVPDPVTVIRNLASQVTQGGVVLFMEYDIEGVVIEPESPLARFWLDRVLTTFRRIGVDTRAGLRMYDQFVDAGLRSPRMQQFAWLEKAPAHSSIRELVDIILTLKPYMVETGVATEQEIDPDDLKSRLEREIAEYNPIIVSQPLIAAWTHVR
jgi:ubiquinone/menaquinone biosynthesis C-methylase UbiE